MENTMTRHRDTIDLRELFNLLNKRKKLIGLITALSTLTALLYTFTATEWWQTNATIEIGKYEETSEQNIKYLENGQTVSARLKIKYIDSYKHIKNRDSKIQSITALKKNQQFISIISLGKSTTLAKEEITKLITTLQNKHQKIINEIIANKQSQLDTINRKILQIEKYTIQSILDEIKYIKDYNLPSINQKISLIKKETRNAIVHKEKLQKNLASISIKNPALAALQLTTIQGLEYKISRENILLINLNSEKEKLLNTKLPSLTREIKELDAITLSGLEEERKLIKLSMQSHNYHNTNILGKIIEKNHAVKPKKVLTVVVSFITGLMFSIFLVFFLAFIQGFKEEK